MAKMVIATRREPAGVIEVWLEQRAGELWLGEDPAGSAFEAVRVPPNALFATFNR